MTRRRSILPIFLPHLGCPNNCVFCNQKTIQSKPLAPTELINLIKNMHYKKNNATIQEVAFYGGTFSNIPDDITLPLLDVIHKNFGRDIPIRISTRPDAIDDRILAKFLDMGVKVVELGVQSFNDDVLKLSNRGHDSSCIELSLNLLRKANLSVGFQIMLGLPGDTVERFIATIEKTIELKPDFVRLSPTLVLKGTPLEKMFNDKKYKPISIKESVQLCAKAKIMLFNACIPIYRMGLLLANETGCGQENIVAGPFHPAFAELVDSYISFQSILQTIKNDKKVNMVSISHNSRDTSIFLGQNRSNIARFLEMGINIQFEKNDQLQRGWFQINNKRYCIFH